MRILSSLISALLLAWAFKAAMASGRTRWMPLGLLFLASPMITYMAAMVNPQGVEISSAALLWVALIRLLQGFDPALKAEEATSEGRLPLSRGLLWTLVAVSAALLANARALGPLWVVIVIALAFTVVGWRATRNLFTTAKSYGPISIVALASLFSLGWTLFTGSLSGQAAANDAPLVGASFMRGARATLGAMPGFIQQAIGVFGWLDTWLPGWLYWVYLVAMLLLLVPSLLVADRRGKLKLGIVLVAAFLVPVLVQGYSVRQTGMIWQGRYGLFLYVAIPIVAALLLSRSAGPRLNLLTVKVTVVAAGLFAAFSVAAFFFALHRYVVGGGKPIASMMDAARWQPPLGWVALCVLFALVIAGYTAWIIRLAVLARRRDDLLTANA